MNQWKKELPNLGSLLKFIAYLQSRVSSIHNPSFFQGGRWHLQSALQRPSKGRCSWPTTGTATPSVDSAPMNHRHCQHRITPPEPTKFRARACRHLVAAASRSVFGTKEACNMISACAMGSCKKILLS